MNAAQGNLELNYGSPCIDAADGLVASLTDLTGAPRYNDPGTPAKGGVPNASGAYPDMGAFEFVQTASSPVDLIASSVNGPATETAGQAVTVQWNDLNIGTASATGPWHDTISLVPGDGSAPLVAATVLVAQDVVLGPDKPTRHRSASSFLAGTPVPTNGRCRSTAEATFLKGSIRRTTLPSHPRLPCCKTRL